MKKTSKIKKSAILLITSSAFIIVIAFSVGVYNENQDKYASKYRGVIRSIERFADSYCRTHKMELIEEGNFREESDSKIIFGIWLRSYAKDSIQDARRQALSLVNSFYAMLENESSTSDYLEEIRNIPCKYDRSELKKELIGIKIAYWDEDVNRPKAPYIAQVDFYNNTFHYYEADPETQALCFVHEESFEDALSNINEEKL